ncbi:hypothetical protein [Burkholderia multivorans]|uniref:hypothetical protein n=1 Tax=Burkholderia multivorans TaxID=87883 RepID=UPI00158A0F0D|nr:hypothetical protein [Burkholderia multivorans]MBR8049213.1 hypothetical protein [Burkholderia multivorans]MBY4672262.1 hypothetical protein [Burkholderia multivorans]MDR8877767.1 hypothetical protein [Burkholderia multivorans]MDR8882354.1 hypothetical protein [Burkholderia multivorans]MDR8888714.1 hypothetical protein [Burkholderia multivorans]
MRAIVIGLLTAFALGACGKQSDADQVYGELPRSNPRLASSSAVPAIDANAAERAVFGSIHSKRIKH